MRSLTFALSAAIIVVFPASLAAQEQESPAAAEASEPAVDEAKDKPIVVTEKKVCRNVTAIGSRVPQRVCRTETQVKDDMDATRDVMDELRREGGLPSEDGSLLDNARAQMGTESRGGGGDPR